MQLAAVAVASSAAVFSSVASAVAIDLNTGGQNYVYSTTLDGALPIGGDGFFTGFADESNLGSLSIQLTQNAQPYIGGDLDIDGNVLGGSGAAPVLPGSAAPNLDINPNSISVGTLVLNDLFLDIGGFLPGQVEVNPGVTIELLALAPVIGTVSGDTVTWDVEIGGNAASANYTDFTTPGLIASATGPAASLINALSLDMLRYRLELNTATNEFDFLGQTLNGSLVSASGALAPIPVPASVWMFGTALVGLAASRRRRQA